jgi:signal transduction histidine kinase
MPAAAKLQSDLSPGPLPGAAEPAAGGAETGPQRAPDELEAFSYAASHELRAPLQIIRGFAEAIVSDEASVLSEESRGYLERIRRSAARIDATVSGLLSYARLAREKIVLQDVRLDGLLADILQQYDPLITESGAEVRVESDLPVVYGEAEALFQAVSNLLSNALKFTASGDSPRIRIWAEADGPKVRIWVEDHGIGIEAHNQARIFNLFERLNSPHAYPGTGVGLSLVRRAVEKIGGQVGVKSTLGGGSRFWIELPRGRAEYPG